MKFGPSSPEGDKGGASSSSKRPSSAAPPRSGLGSDDKPRSGTCDETPCVELREVGVDVRAPKGVRSSSAAPLSGQTCGATPLESEAGDGEPRVALEVGADGIDLPEVGAEESASKMPPAVPATTPGDAREDVREGESKLERWPRRRRSRLALRRALAPRPPRPVERGPRAVDVVVAEDAARSPGTWPTGDAAGTKRAAAAAAPAVVVGVGPTSTLSDRSTPSCSLRSGGVLGPARVGLQRLCDSAGAHHSLNDRPQREAEAGSQRLAASANPPSTSPRSTAPESGAPR